MIARLHELGAGEDRITPLLDDEVVEIPLLLAGWQASALETAAFRRGLTAGEMVRDLLRDFLARLPEAAVRVPGHR